MLDHPGAGIAAWALGPKLNVSISSQLPSHLSSLPQTLGEIFII